MAGRIAVVLLLLAGCTSQVDPRAREIATETCQMLASAEEASGQISADAAILTLGFAAVDARDAGVDVDELDRALRRECRRLYDAAMEASSGPSTFDELG